MNNRICFADLKARVGIDQVADYLGLNLKRSGDALRGRCPLCDSKAGFSATISICTWHCFSCRETGDMLKLLALVRGWGPNKNKEAAQEIAQHFLNGNGVKPKPYEKEFKPDTYAERIEHEHELVQAMGLDPVTAKKFGIGYMRKGIHRGRVVIPFRNDDGTIAGYFGYNPALDPPLKFPKL